MVLFVGFLVTLAIIFSINNIQKLSGEVCSVTTDYSRRHGNRGTRGGNKRVENDNCVLYVNVKKNTVL